MASRHICDRCACFNSLANACPRPRRDPKCRSAHMLYECICCVAEFVEQATSSLSSKLYSWDVIADAIAGKDLVGSLRTNDPVFMRFVSSWWQELLPRMQPLMFSKGGPILMVQIENEYGFRTFLQDKPYLQVLV